MAVSRVKSSSVLQGFPKYRSMLAGNAGYDPAATFLIQRINGSGVSSVTFSSIPQTYSSLQIRMNWLASVSGNGLLLEINGSSSGIYDNHWLRGNGSAASASYSINTSFNFLPTIINGSSTTYPTGSIVDIHNYTSTTQNKTIRSFGGVDLNGSGEVVLASGLWRNTSAITSLRIYMSSGTFSSGSTFALYGMK
jgi:hypothetical protein